MEDDRLAEKELKDFPLDEFDAAAVTLSKCSRTSVILKLLKTFPKLYFSPLFERLDASRSDGVGERDRNTSPSLGFGIPAFSAMAIA